MTKDEYIQLVKLSQQGDQQAAARLIAHLSVRLKVVVKHKLWGWSADDQNELVQATLATFVEKIQEIIENPSAFVVQILSNKIGNELRVRRSRQYVAVASDIVTNQDMLEGATSSGSVVLASNETADSRIESSEELTLVVRAIDSLKPFCRAVFKGMIEGMYVSEIWDALRLTEPGLSRSTFDKRIFDCRKQLRRLTQNRA